MRMSTVPLRPSTMRTMQLLPLPGTMKSISATCPCGVSNRVSSTRLPSRYCRVAGGPGTAGAIMKRPCSAVPSRAARQAALSKRGQHSQSMLPLRPTSAAVTQSPIRA